MRSLNPLWRIYLFIVACSLVTASVVIYLQWGDIKNNAEIKLKYANKIFTHSMQSLLHKNEALLNILGDRLIELDALQQPEQARLLVDDLIKRNKELAGFGLADKSGQLVVTSFNIDRENLPNLLHSPETADSFKKALVSSKMVMGRTYYMKALKEWVIPLRYRITDKNDKVIAIMATGYKIDTDKNIWSRETLPENMSTVIIRKDLYRQYVSGVKKNDYLEIYGNQVKIPAASFLYDYIQGKYPEAVSAITRYKNKAVISSISYDPDYEYYTFIYTPLANLYKELVLPLSWLLALLLLFNITLYLVFRSNIVTTTKSKRDMQAMFDHSPAVISIQDLESHFIFINQKFEQLYKVKQKDVIGKKPGEIFTADIAENMSSNDNAIINDGYTFESEEKIQRSGKTFSFISTRFPLLDSNGNAYAIGTILTDMTQHKKQEELLRNSQKMEALGQLTSGIAHDYNNMLGVIIGYTGLLEDEMPKENSFSGFVKEIDHAAKRGAKLTKKLLSFSRNSSADPEVHDLNTILKDEKDMLEKTLTARIKLTFDLEKNLWPVLVDAGELEDAILNITINAMHAINENGELIIQTENQHVDKISAGLIGIEPGDYTILSFTDNGCGMSKETRDKIFDPFYSTKGTKGTGLGLSQVYGFVVRSGGKIVVYSEINYGSQFVFYFPRYSGDTNVAHAKEHKVEELLKGNESILVVDDEPAILELTGKILSKEGYTVYTADNAQQALDILESNPVDLMITDVVMPEMDGFQLATEVQEKYPAVKIQLASGFTDNNDSGLVDKRLYDNLLHKPFTAKKLLTQIRKLLDE